MTKQRRSTLTYLVIIAVLALGAFWVARTETTAESEIPLSGQPETDTGTADLKIAPVPAALAPDFALEDLTGTEIRLNDLHGQPVLINFWATWCGPCRLEMPAIQERYERFKGEGLVVLAVNFDEPASAVETFRGELGLTFPLLLDQGAAVQKLYRIRGYPASYFIDADGVIQVQHIGVMTEGQLDENLTRIGVGT
jgi:cytochrome c biogenesis protein CcmG/thiol:disulfide interchange protein DsbE